jgi:hypothetical protein
MQWGFHRQLGIALGSIALIMLIAGGSWYLFFYKAPSCVDRTQNQDEEGVDCGGVCSALCEAPKVSVVWARSVRVAPGVYHAVALIRNTRTDAGTDALPYTVRLFDADNILIAEIKGMTALDPGEVAPLFKAAIRTGERVPARTFVEFGQSSWKREERTDNPVKVTTRELDSDALRLTAAVENTTALPVERTTVTALLYASDETLVAASQTVVRSLAPRATTDVVFTWQEPFSAPVVRVDIVARVVPAADR